MGETIQGVMVLEIPNKAGGFEEVKTRFKGWLAKQSLAVEAAFVTTTSAVQGASVGCFMGFIPDFLRTFCILAFAGGPLVQAHNFAVMTGTNAGISCVMKRLRGKEDVQSSMVAAFGSCAMYALVRGMGGPNLAAKAVISGLLFALGGGGIYQRAQRCESTTGTEIAYSRPRREEPRVERKAKG